MEVSAKTAFNIVEVFKSLTSDILDKITMIHQMQLNN